MCDGGNQGIFIICAFSDIVTTPLLGWMTVCEDATKIYCQFLQ